MKINSFIVFTLVSIQMTVAQENKLPYYEIPEYSKTFNAGTIAARMIDGLGFRYYWVTDNLTETDLKYRANAEGRSTEETIDHILSLSNYILSAALKKTIVRENYSKLFFTEKRQQTLNKLKTAADILRQQTDLSDNEMVFNEQFKFPFWNIINGPIADALTHCGQIAIYRRSSGNPINPKADVLSGTVKD